MRYRALIVTSCALLPFVLPGLPADALAEDAAPITPEQEKFFESKIRPVLAANCFECHSAKKQQAGLRLDHRDFLIKGGDTGSVLTPGKVADSRLWQVLQHDPLDTQMPPDSKLSDAALADIRNWIEMGAPWPGGPPTAATADAAASDWTQHWAYQPITRPQPPAVGSPGWQQTAIDRFIAAKLEGQGLTPSPAADRETLIRRLKYDLLGLPADFEEIQSFVNDASPGAYEALVDRYLASPHFGERWARHWLDVARYSDTKGYVFQEDRNYPEAWKYREWVINALNKDLPYDRFLMTQIAGDLVSEDPADLHAMGYLTLGRRFLNNKHDIIDDRIDVVTRGMMGLTVTCARCHDHKYDPIPIADYYSLYGVFDSSDEPKNEPSTLRLTERDQPVEPVIFRRGNPRDRGDRVPRQFLMLIERDERKPFEQGSGRLEMARAIASPDNPLTARVWANRVWGHLTGHDLVRTPSDFGVRSDPPTHPQLLDYLAGRLIDGGWSTKALIREIVLAQAYRQSSVTDPRIAAADPDNDLFSHMNRRRVDFEVLRDAMLSAAGRLDLTLGGESVDITAEPFPTRRTVYAFVERQNLPGVFRTFDFAGPDAHSPKRFETNVPQQALFLMNSPFVVQQSRALAARTEAGDPRDQVRQLYHIAFGRDPSDAELELAVGYITAAPEAVSPADDNPWSYGYGEVDPEAGVLKSFTPLPVFTGTAWQGGAQLPDPTLGWVTLRPAGGHVGNDLQHAAVRRWTAPVAGTLSIRGRLKHPAEEGDGVRGQILLNSTLSQGVWDVHHGEARTSVRDLQVAAGDTVDFVTDMRTNVNHDSFEWKVFLSLAPADGAAEFASRSEADFRGPRPEPLQPWEQLAQILMLSNEFQFVD